MDQNPQNKRLNGWIIALAILGGLGILFVVFSIFASLILVQLNVAREKAREAARAKNTTQLQQPLSN